MKTTKNFDERKEQVLFELRSEVDYQKEYNYLYSEYIEYTAKVKELETTLKETTEFYNQLIEKYKSKRNFIVDQTEDIIAKAKKENIKIKEKSLKYY